MTLDDERYFQASRLIKKATKHKKTDIHKAIALIREAIELYSSSDYSFHFKLANYLQLAGRNDDAFSVYNLLLAGLDPDDVHFYNRNSETIYSEVCKFLYKEKSYSDYLYYYCLWLWHLSLAHACQGVPGYEEILKTLTNESLLRFMAPKKIDSCFKKLNKAEAKPEFDDRLISFFKAYLPKIIKLHDISHRIQWEETHQPYENEPRSANSDFMKRYNELNSLTLKFHSFINEKLLKLVVS